MNKLSRYCAWHYEDNSKEERKRLQIQARKKLEKQLFIVSVILGSECSSDDKIEAIEKVLSL